MPETPQFGDQSTERFRAPEARPDTSIYHPPIVEDRELRGQQTRNEIFIQLPYIKQEFSRVLTQSEMRTMTMNIEINPVGRGSGFFTPRTGTVSVSFLRNGNRINLEQRVSWNERPIARMPEVVHEPQPGRPIARMPVIIEEPQPGRPIARMPVVREETSIQGMPDVSVMEGLQNILARINHGNFNEHDDQDLDHIFDDDDVREEREEQEYRGKIDQAAESTVAIIRYLQGGPRGDVPVSDLRARANTAMREAHALPYYSRRSTEEGRSNVDIPRDLQAAIDRAVTPAMNQFDGREIYYRTVFPQLGESFTGRRGMFYMVSLSGGSEQQPPELRIIRSRNEIYRRPLLPRNGDTNFSRTMPE